MIEIRNYIHPGEYTQHHDTWFRCEEYVPGGPCLAQCDCRPAFSSKAPCSGFCFRWNENAKKHIRPVVFRRVAEPDETLHTIVFTPASQVRDWNDLTHTRYLDGKIKLEDLI